MTLERASVVHGPEHMGERVVPVREGDSARVRRSNGCESTSPRSCCTSRGSRPASWARPGRRKTVLASGTPSWSVVRLTFMCPLFVPAAALRVGGSGRDTGTGPRGCLARRSGQVRPLRRGGAQRDDGQRALHRVRAVAGGVVQVRRPSGHQAESAPVAQAQAYMLFYQARPP